MTINAAALGTIFDLVPVFFPFLAPGKRQAASLAKFAGQVSLFSHFHLDNIIWRCFHHANKMMAALSSHLFCL